MQIYEIIYQNYTIKDKLTHQQARDFLAHFGAVKNMCVLYNGKLMRADPID